MSECDKYRKLRPDLVPMDDGEYENLKMEINNEINE